MLEVGAGPLVGDLGQRRFLFQQARAEAFQTVQARRFRRRFAAQQRQAGADRFLVHAAHQFADVLHLAAAGAVGGDLLAIADRGQQGFRQIDALQLADRQLDQLGAEVAQRVHRLLLLGLRGANEVFGVGIVLHGSIRNGNGGLL
ncbi:hypothetical protein SDC9_200795 [bioreactor metagenome]|uniref:Uncharacterized protein n=1 Tax=bioreactor metagenome TaxID=1076179 RepID=A0A645IP78_9ZZZZ